MYKIQFISLISNEILLQFGHKAYGQESIQILYPITFQENYSLVTSLLEPSTIQNVLCLLITTKDLNGFAAVGFYSNPNNSGRITNEGWYLAIGY